MPSADKDRQREAENRWKMLRRVQGCSTVFRCVICGAVYRTRRGQLVHERRAHEANR